MNSDDIALNEQTMKDQRQQTGKLGEAAACNFLEEANYTLFERNWRCRIGEIDIIAEGEGRLVFIEVRTRKEGGRFGTAAESVDRRKQQKVRDTAQVYLRSIGRSGAAIRFDVITITVSRSDGAIVECKHYVSAF